jgi:Kef-type K+ transport system membrane component KefB
VNFGTLALIGLCALCGPLLSYVSHDAVPAVVGEILAGMIIGRTGLRAIDPANATLTFLSDIGFAMLMLNAGMNVPLGDPRLVPSLGRGARAEVVVGVLALGAGFLVSTIGGAGHPFVYTVLLASGSAAIVLPVIQERGLGGESVLTVIAQVTVADIAATVAVPFVLRPSQAGRVAGGTVLIAACVIAIYGLARWASG